MDTPEDLSKDTDPADEPDTAGEPDAAAEVERLREENARLRAEEAEVRAALDKTAAKVKQQTSTRRRAVGSNILLVIGLVALIASVLMVWVRAQVFDTDRYVDTMAPLATDPVIVGALSNRISGTVSDELDIDTVAKEALPEKAQLLAGPIAAGADNLIKQATDRVLESKEFQKAWEDANRTAHADLVALLEGEDGKILAEKDGQVVVELGGVVKTVAQRVDERFGWDLSDKITGERLKASFVIADAKQVKSAQLAVRWLNRLAWFTLIVALGCLAGAVALSADRRKMVLRMGIGVAVSMFLLALGLALARDGFITNLPSGVERPDAVAAVFDTITAYLRQSIRAVFALGVVMAIGAWLAGPSSAAVWVRNWWDRLLGRGGQAAGEHMDLGPVPAWVAAHVNGLRAVILGLAAIVLVAWDRPTGKAVLLVFLCALIPLAIVQLLAGAARQPEVSAG